MQSILCVQHVTVCKPFLHIFHLNSVGVKLPGFDSCLHHSLAECTG